MVWDRATGKSRELTGNFDRTCESQEWQGPENRIVFGAEDKGYHRLYSVDVANGEITNWTKNPDSNTGAGHFRRRQDHGLPQIFVRFAPAALVP